MVHTFVCVQCIDIYMGAKYSDDVGTQVLLCPFVPLLFFVPIGSFQSIKASVVVSGQWDQIGPSLKDLGTKKSNANSPNICKTFWAIVKNSTF